MPSVTTPSGIYDLGSSGFWYARDGSGPYTVGPNGISVSGVPQFNASLLTGGGVESSSTVGQGNSSILPLGIGGVFTGIAENILGYAEVRVAVFSNVASATDGLQFQQSTDGVNWDGSDSYTVAANTYKVFGAGVGAKFFRIVYTNGGVAQAAFRLFVSFHGTVTKPTSVRTQDGRSNENDFEEVAAYGQQYNGSTWDRMRTPNVFIPLNAVSINAESAIWTPAAGRRFRLMGATLSVGTVAGNVILRDGTGLATIAIIPAGAVNTPAQFDFRNGIVSGAINRILTAQGALTATLSGTLWGTEEV